ncbi:MAG: hypothetical protein ACO1O6_05540 [Bacteroidota bacterium]
MNNIILSGLFGLCFSFAFTQMELNGKYLGQNLYFQNPNIENDVPCVDSIYINGIKYPGLINQSAFELNLAGMELELGSDLYIQLYHRDGCKPRILNPVQPRISQVEFLETDLQPNGELTWKVKNEMIGNRLPFKIEQMTKDKQWLEIAQIEQRWEEENEYHFQLKFSKGKNTFRIGTQTSPVKYIYSENISLTP